MGSIENVTHINLILVFLGLFTVLFAVKEIIEIFCYFIKKFRIKTGIDEDKQTVENRLKTLEKHDNWQYQEIQKISKGIDDIKDNLTKREIKDKEKTVATLRGQLYGLHEKFVTKGYIDKSGLKTFIELGKIYEAAGGDDIYHDKLYPEIMSLPIRED